MCSHGHTTHLPIWIIFKELREWTWMIIDWLYQPILCKWKMLELGGCPSWVDPYRSNMYEIWGKQFLGVGTIKNCPETSLLKIYISQSLSNSISGALAFFFLEKRKRKKERTSKRKVHWRIDERFLCYEARWFQVWLWFHSRPGLKIWTVKQFYWILDFFVFKR